MSKESDGEDEGATAKLIRDSAIIIGGATGLLYVMSHVFGMAYVSVFGVESGFQGEGLGNLAMINLPGSLALGGFGAIIFAALWAKSQAWAWVAGTLVVLVGLGPVFAAAIGS